MKLKNNALQELYDTIVNSIITISPFAFSPFDTAFRECDEKLQCVNEILLSANSDLANYKQKLEKEIEGMKEHVLENHKIITNISSERDALEKERDDLLSRAHCTEDEVEELKIELHTAEEARDNIRAELEAKVKRMDEITKDRDFFFKQYHALKDDYEKLKTRTDCLRVEVEWYRKHYRDQSDKIQNLNKKLKYLTSQYQKLTRENKRLQNNVRAGYDQGQTDLWVKLQDVKDVQPEDFDVECKTLGDVIDMDLEDFLDAYKKWQEEKDIKYMRDYLERFCMGRLCYNCPLHKDGFNCSRGKWLAGVPNEKIKRYYEKARSCSRYTLKNATYYFDNKPVTMAKEVICEDFCKAVWDADTKITENLRKGCTFEAEVNVNKDLFEKLCGMKSEEKKSKPGELVITTRGVTTANYTEATMNAIKEAVRRLEKSLPALDPWESTITGSIKVDDILGKTDDTEHKLEYGDAVRLPWRDYDYMYIGPDEEEETIVHLFDPENHAIVTTHISNVRYNEGRILVSEEDDIRKIWKYMK